jgi:hypothetical protein
MNYGFSSWAIVLTAVRKYGDPCLLHSLAVDSYMMSIGMMLAAAENQK